jgi:hypothetical protein
MAQDPAKGGPKGPRPPTRDQFWRGQDPRALPSGAPLASRLPGSPRCSSGVRGWLAIHERCWRIRSCVEGCGWGPAKGEPLREAEPHSRTDPPIRWGYACSLPSCGSCGRGHNPSGEQERPHHPETPEQGEGRDGAIGYSCRGLQPLHRLVDEAGAREGLSQARERRGEGWATGRWWQWPRASTLRIGPAMEPG